MLVLSVLLVMPAIILLRRIAQTTSTLRQWVLTSLRLSTGDRTQKPRSVWQNPIAWREARTKASATRSWMLRTGFIIGGLGGAITILWMLPPAGSAGIDQSRQ